MKKIKLIWDYITKSRREFIDWHRHEERKDEAIALYGDAERGYELRARKGMTRSLTMPREYYKPLDEQEAVRVIFGGWKAAERIFHQRLGR